MFYEKYHSLLSYALINVVIGICFYLYVDYLVLDGKVLWLFYNKGVKKRFTTLLSTSFNCLHLLKRKKPPKMAIATSYSNPHSARVIKENWHLKNLKISNIWEPRKLQNLFTRFRNVKKFNLCASLSSNSVNSLN